MDLKGVYVGFDRGVLGPPGSLLCEGKRIEDRLCSLIISSAFRLEMSTSFDLRCHFKDAQYDRYLPGVALDGRARSSELLCRSAQSVSSLLFGELKAAAIPKVPEDGHIAWGYPSYFCGWHAL